MGKEKKAPMPKEIGMGKKFPGDPGGLLERMVFIGQQKEQIHGPLRERMLCPWTWAYPEHSS